MENSLEMSWCIQETLRLVICSSTKIEAKEIIQISQDVLEYSTFIYLPFLENCPCSMYYSLAQTGPDSVPPSTLGTLTSASLFGEAPSVFHAVRTRSFKSFHDFGWSS